MTHPDSDPPTTTTPPQAPPPDDQHPWFEPGSVGVPPVVDPKTTEQIRQANGAEVGQCGLVTEQALTQPNRFKASAAQYSTNQVKATIAALDTLGTTDPQAQANATELKRLVAETDDLTNTATSHFITGARYGNTVLLRKYYTMEFVRTCNKSILARAEQERQKDNPDKLVMAASDLIEAAQKKDAADKGRTRHDNENRTSDQDGMVAQLQAALAQAQQVNAEQAQALDQLRQQMLLQGVTPPAPTASGSTTRARHTKATTTPVTSPAPPSPPSTGSRRKRPR